jgi:hypothetical protein
MPEKGSPIKTTLRDIAGGALLGGALALAAAVRALAARSRVSEAAAAADLGAGRSPEPGGDVADAAAERATAPLRPGWERVAREPLPQPTYWPAALAFAVTLLAWGIATTYVISAIGALFLLVSLLGWIGDLLHDH